MRGFGTVLGVLGCTVALVLTGAGAASAATYVVTSGDDADDGNCTGEHCSLREAIHAANATTELDRLLINEGFTITPATRLPAITSPLYIRTFGDGRCHGDSAPLVLDGDSAAFPGLVFHPGSDGSIVCGANIRGFTNGIELQSTRNTIRQSGIGTTNDGMAADPNSHAGIVVSNDHNTIGDEFGGNVISGNRLYGVLVLDATGTRVARNRIGTDWPGTGAVPNEVGVYVDDTADHTTIGGGAGSRNVISGNSEIGVHTGDGLVLGNRIGTDETGTAALPNGRYGVRAFAGVQIGSPVAGEGNVVSGNGRAEVGLSAGATVQGNVIGPAADGSELDDVLGQGIELLEGAGGTVIGGSAEGAGNVIAGHDTGVLADAPLGGLVIQGNTFGLASDGTTAIRSTDGIWLGPDVTGALIGGEAAGAGNTVAGHEVYGIQVFGDETRIEGNTIGLDAGGEEAGNYGGVYVGSSAEDTAIGGAPDGAANTISGNGAGLELAFDSKGTVVQGNRIGTDRQGTGDRGNVDGIALRGEAVNPRQRDLRERPRRCARPITGRARDPRRQPDRACRRRRLRARQPRAGPADRRGVRRWDRRRRPQPDRPQRRRRRARRRDRRRQHPRQRDLRQWRGRRRRARHRPARRRRERQRRRRPRRAAELSDHHERDEHLDQRHDRCGPRPRRADRGVLEPGVRRSRTRAGAAGARCHGRDRTRRSDALPCRRDRSGRPRRHRHRDRPDHRPHLGVLGLRHAT
jgi:CSLREA domain-containing protein